MTKYVKLIQGTQIETLTNDQALEYLDEEELNAQGYKEFVPATKEQGKPYTYSYEETETQIIEHVEEIIPDPIDEEKARREQFHRDFFNTSLGYIRRKVTMQDGSTKDFLSDLLPAIDSSVSKGLTVNVIAYDEPDFTHDVEDWTIYQHIQAVTAQFIQECYMQLQNDFMPIN